VGSSTKKPVIGILGGIGSGKSTVAAEFGKLGCGVIDADEIAHKLLEKKGVKEKIIALFGPVQDSAGKIERKKLAEIVFADADKLASLTKILHPFVLARTEQLINQYNQENQVKAIVLDMPLLMEVGWEKRCDRLIFVDCERLLRVQRMREMGLFDENKIKIRENFQISLDNKAAIAENTINNNSGLSTLVRQVADIFFGIIING